MLNKLRSAMEDRKDARARLRSYRAISAISDPRVQAEVSSISYRSR